MIKTCLLLLAPTGAQKVTLCVCLSVCVSVCDICELSTLSKREILRLVFNPLLTYFYHIDEDVD